MPSNGEVWTDHSYSKVDRDLAEDYNVRLAELFGGVVRTGANKDGPSTLLVARSEEAQFHIEEILDCLPDWISAIETFQDAVRARTQNAET